MSIEDQIARERYVELAIKSGAGHEAVEEAKRIQAYCEGQSSVSVSVAVLEERERCAQLVEEWKAGLQRGEHLDAAIGALANRLRAGEGYPPRHPPGGMTWVE